MVRGFNPGPILTRPPSYYTPTGRRDGEGDDHTGRWRERECVCQETTAPVWTLQAEELPWPSPRGGPGENPSRSVGSGGTGRNLFWSVYAESALIRKYWETDGLRLASGVRDL